MDTGEAVENLKKEETLKHAEAKVEYLGQQLRVLAPFVQPPRHCRRASSFFPRGRHDG